MELSALAPKNSAPWVIPCNEPRKSVKFRKTRQFEQELKRNRVVTVFVLTKPRIYERRQGLGWNTACAISHFFSLGST